MRFFTNRLRGLREPQAATARLDAPGRGVVEFEGEPGKRHVYLLIHKLNPSVGGMMRSMFTRAKMFLDEGHPVTLLTFDHSNNYSALRDAFVREGIADPRMQLRNMFDVMNEWRIEQGGSRKSNDYFADVSEYLMQVTRREGGAVLGARYVDPISGHVVAYHEWSREGVRKFIDEFDVAHTKLRRIHFTADGEFHRILDYDSTGKKPRQDRHFTPNGLCYQVRWFAESDYKVFGAFWIHQDKVEHFPDEARLAARFLERLIGDQSAVLIGDGAGQVSKISFARLPNTLKYMQVHGQHYSVPGVKESGWDSELQGILERSSELDGIVTLTARQRDMVAKSAKCLVTAIPHSVRPQALRDVPRDLQRVVVVSRIDPLKNIEATIRAFAAVLEKVPQATLEIWGNGFREHEEPLHSLVEEFGLGDSVFFRGWTRQSADCFAGAAVNVSTSICEGYQLSTVEAGLQETPTVAFDADFGLSDSIVHGRTGYVTVLGDEADLAQRLIALLQEPDQARAMGEAARARYLEMLSPETVYELWVDRWRRDAGSNPADS